MCEVRRAGKQGSRESRERGSKDSKEARMQGSKKAGFKQNGKQMVEVSMELSYWLIKVASQII